MRTFILAIFLSVLYLVSTANAESTFETVKVESFNMDDLKSQLDAETNTMNIQDAEAAKIAIYYAGQHSHHAKKIAEIQAKIDAGLEQGAEFSKPVEVPVEAPVEIPAVVNEDVNWAAIDVNNNINWSDAGALGK